MAVTETDWDRIRTLYALLVSHLRTTEGHTYSDIAARAGLHPNAVPKFLRYRTPPTIDTFVRLVRGLGMTPATFFVILDNQDVDHHTVATLRAVLLAAPSTTPYSPALRSESSYGVVASSVAPRSQDLEDLRKYIDQTKADVIARLDRLEESRRKDSSAAPAAPRRSGKSRSDRNPSRRTA